MFKYISIPIIGFLLVSSLVLAITNNKLEVMYEQSYNQTQPISAAEREKQLTCLARNIYYESAHEPFEGKVAVAQVTLNRVADSDFPDDVCAVVYQIKHHTLGKTCQFSWYCESPSKLKHINQALYEESYTVAKRVLLEGYRLDSLQEALYYHADYVNPRWKMAKITKIGRHIFYRG